MEHHHVYEIEIKICWCFIGNIIIKDSLVT